MESPNKNMKLLIVDDNPNNLFSFEAALKSPGLEIMAAPSGVEALQILIAHPDISLILMDVQMPGMDGFETAELIRGQRMFKELPILFITAVYRSDDFARRSFDVGAFDYITKPVDSGVLKSKVQVFLTLQQQKLQLGEANAALQAEIIERKQAAAGLVEANARATEMMAELERSNTELEQFAYVASHDLQEPLALVTSFLQLLQRRYKGQLDSEADEFIDFAVNNAARMKMLISDLLAYSQVGTHGREFEPIDADAALDQAVTNLQLTIEKSNAKITRDALPSVKGDFVQMTQLFQNLIGNALKFRNEKYPVVHISAKKNSKVLAQNSEQAQTLADWTFSVQDNGIGLDSQYSERIFTIFQRLHTREEYSGTGIGLAICKKIVERHGGHMWVESEEGQGATFYFTLPIEELALANVPLTA